MGHGPATWRRLWLEHMRACTCASVARRHDRDGGGGGGLPQASALPRGEASQCRCAFPPLSLPARGV
eukprot:scaffold4675_cov378-Prasinococcus_capsulatus_cf.AAC.14